MGVFDFETASERKESQPSRMMSVINNGGEGLRVTIPREIAEEHDITSADHLSIEATEDGFEAKKVEP